MVKNYEFVTIKGIKYVWISNDFKEITIRKGYKFIRIKCKHCKKTFFTRLYKQNKICKYCVKKRERIIPVIPGIENSNLQSLASRCVSRGIKLKKIRRPKKCPFCGSSYHIEGHHPSYYKPSEIMWLCCSCHRLLHRGHKVSSELVVF